MYALYYAPGSANMLVHQVLLEIGAPCTLHRIDLERGEQHGAAYRAINPQGKVPTLLIDGKAHSEAAGLALLLSERHPEAGLAPAPGSAERGEFLQWLFYLANTLQPLFRQWFYPDDQEPPAPEAIKDNARRGVEINWQLLAERIETHGPYLLGECFSLLDLYALMLMRWSRNMPRPATDWPALAAYAQRLKARPSWSELCAAEGLTEWAT